MVGPEKYDGANPDMNGIQRLTSYDDVNDVAEIALYS